MEKFDLRKYMVAKCSIGGYEMLPECEAYENLALETDVDFFRRWEKEQKRKERALLIKMDNKLLDIERVI